MRWRRLLLLGIPSLLLFGLALLLSAVYLLAGAPSQRVPLQLLVLRDDTAVLVDAQGEERPLLDDVSEVAHSFPVPAPDRRSLAYVTAEQDGVALVKLDLLSGERIELYRSRENPPFYLSWSPNASYISFLTTLGDETMGTNLVASDGSTAAQLLSPAGPSFFAWTPDSSMLLLHLGGSLFDGGHMALYTINNDTQRSIANDPGLFQAPAWSVNGQELFYVAQPPVTSTTQISINDVESVLTRVRPDGSEPRVLAREPQSVIFFSRAPVSDAIAYTRISPAGFGGLSLIDAQGNPPRQLSADDEEVIACFWSPDARQIAYLSVDGTRGIRTLTWHVVNADGSERRRLNTFTPSEAFDQMLSFFDAYAHAFSIWSPDSRQLTYAADNGVFTLDIASGESTRIGPGRLGFWVGE